MRQHYVAATAVLVVFTTILLSACGSDDGASASIDQDSAAPNTAPTSGRETSQTVTPHSAFGASATLTNAPGGAAAAASDSAVQSVQASLAADSQQVAPVLHYAPADSGQNGSSN